MSESSATPRRGRPSRIALGAAIVWAAAWLPSAGETAAPESSLEALKRNMGRIQHLIRNAGMKLRNGVHGIDNTSNRPATPARHCCGTNLDRIATSVGEMKQSFQTLRSCYDETGNAEGISRAEFARMDLRAMEQNIAVFEKAPDLNQAGGAAAALTRSFNQLRSSIDELEACPAASGKDAKKTRADKKSKDKKKKKRAETD